MKPGRSMWRRCILGLVAVILLVCLVLTAVRIQTQARLEKLRAERAEFSGTSEAEIPDISGRDICSGESGAVERTYVLIENQ